MTNTMTLHISKGNSKLGSIPNVSLPPVITCRCDAPCKKKCYAKRPYSRFPNCKNAWDENLDFLKANESLYWAQIWRYITDNDVKWFRYHVSGDIIDTRYLARMIELARICRHTNFLCFTKRDDIVEDLLLKAKKPDNLMLILSAWEGFEPRNTHNLPVARVIFEGQKPQDDWKICGGNCFECACRGVGCWELKNGETIAFKEH